MNKNIKNIFFQLSAILILVAAVLYGFNPMFAKYIMLVGVVGFATTTFTSGYPGKSIRGKRLFNLQIFAIILMAISDVLMFFQMTEWIIALLIAAVLTLYSSIMLPIVYKKEQAEEKK